MEEAEVRAEYLAKVLWRAPNPEEVLQTHPDMRSVRMAPDCPAIDDDYTAGEIRKAEAKQAKKKSLKPFGIPQEAWQALMDSDIPARIANLLNESKN